MPMAAWSFLKRLFLPGFTAKQPIRAPTRPRVILLLRHGEKSGKKQDIHLNKRGQERAQALPALFPNRFPAPDFIFATKATATSNRPVEFVSPLAQSIGLPVNSRFANLEYPALANELSKDVYAGKTVLVCWHHGKLPLLAVALGANGTLPPWPETQFDRIWQLEYLGKDVQFKNLPQNLLPGDATR